MKIPQSKALELIDQKISQFQEILAKATYENRYDETYKLAYYGTETLLTELFSKEEAIEFRRNVTSIIALVGGKIDYAKELQDYKDHINSCIAQLKVYRGRIQNFWGTDKLKTVAKSARAPVVNEKKRTATKKKKPKLTPGNVISAIIVLVILTILYSPTIISVVSSSRQPEKLELSLVPYSPYYAYTRDDLRKYGAERTGVLGYSANIYLSFERTDVEVGGAIKFRVEIANIGNSLNKPYFYVFLVNNTGNIVSVFPDETGLLTSDKLSRWSVYNQGGIDYWRPRGESALSIPRQTLISGGGDYWNNTVNKKNCQIWLERQIATDPSQIGKWEVWVFLFDEQYHTSEGKDLQSADAITYTTEFFDVVPEMRTEPASPFQTFWLWGSRLASFGFVVISALGLFRRLSPWIDAHSPQILLWWKNNRWIIIGSALLLIFYIILFLLGA